VGPPKIHYFFRLADGRITSAWGLEDTMARLRQLGLLSTVDGPRSAAD
jgi:hypothetical protein